MPTQAFFDDYPPFPDGLPILSLPRLSYQRLLSNDAKESQALWQASTDHGFFLLDLSDVGGGSQLLGDIRDVFTVGREFFDLPLDEKRAFKVNTGNVGYKPMGVMKLADGKTDLTEICAVSRDSIYDSEVYIPTPFAKKRLFLSTIVERLHPVAAIIITHLARHLNVSMDTMDRMHNLTEPSATVLRFIHNPPQPEGTERQTSLLGHTDSGSITVLFAALGGLQILPADMEDTPDNWRWVKPEPNCAIINIGDPLVHWTGGILRSSYHRVLYAPGAQSSEERYSFGYFLKPADMAPMRRLQEGSVIPELSPDEKEIDTRTDHYDYWHRSKTRGIMKGENSTSRGGRTLAVK